MKFELRSNYTRIYDDSGVLLSEKATSRVARVYFNDAPCDFGLLPPAVRWISSGGRGFILERPPQEITTTINNTSYVIPLPWTVYGIKLGEDLQIAEAFLFARPLALSTPEDVLHTFPFPGVHVGNHIDLEALEPELEVGPQLQFKINKFWEHAARSDVNGTLTEESMPEGWFPFAEEGKEKYLTFLQSLSVKDVAFVDFQVASQPTMQQLMDHLHGEVTEGQQPANVMEYLAELVKRA